MHRSESEILADAETRAYQILSTTRLEAQRHVDCARDDAAALLLEEQRKAERLLESQRSTASDSKHSAEGIAEALPQKQADALREHERSEAKTLLESQKRAADVLLAAQKKAAAKFQGAVASQAADTVMRGQREAVAILLEARMLVEGSRGSDADK